VKSGSSEFQKILSFALGFLVDDVMIGGYVAVILMTSSIYPTSRYCGSKLYWILDQNTSLWNPWSTF